MSFLYVGLGGALGAMLRYSFSVLLPTASGGFPWATWLANVIGCACAGIFFACSEKIPVLQQEARLFLMVGILGGFTTFSSFSLETYQMIRQAAYTMAFTYVISSLFVGLIALALVYFMFKSILN